MLSAEHFSKKARKQVWHRFHTTQTMHFGPPRLVQTSLYLGALISLNKYKFWWLFLKLTQCRKCLPWQETLDRCQRCSSLRHFNKKLHDDHYEVPVPMKFAETSCAPISQVEAAMRGTAWRPQTTRNSQQTPHASHKTSTSSLYEHSIFFPLFSFMKAIMNNMNCSWQWLMETMRNA